MDNYYQGRSKSNLTASLHMTQNLFHLWSMIKCTWKHFTSFAEPVPRSVGHAVRRHKSLDTAKFWTYVDPQKFKHKGVIKRIELFAGASGRPLLVGVFRPRSRKACHYRVVRLVTLKSIKKGRNKVRFVSFFGVSICVYIGLTLLWNAVHEKWFYFVHDRVSLCDHWGR